MKDADLFTPERPHREPGQMRFREIAQAGRRVLRAAAYTIGDDDQDPELRLLVWTAWQDDPPLPIGAHCVSFPASSLPELVEALTALGRQAPGA
jgi:hypothetical protein